MTFNKKTLACCVAAAAATSLMASNAQAQMSDDEVRIGYLADMSGTYRDLAGPGGLTAMEMAVEDFGGSVNGAPIVISSADDRNSADVGANTVRGWIDEDNVDMVGGLVASSVSIAVSNVIEENDGLAIVSGSAASSITNEHCTPNHIHWVYDTYPLANGTAKAVVDQGGDSWFMLTADYAFGHALEADVTSVVEANGGEIVGGVRHPFPTNDFSSYILQAQGSGAKIVGLANAGSDTVNAITTASQFGLTQSGQQLAGLLIFLNDVHALGLEATQNLLLTTGWYWDMDDQSREWAERYYAEEERMPTMVQAGIYSSTMHYLKAVEAAGTDDPETVRAQMAEMPIDDFFARNGRIREDGRMIHDMYLAQVKTPEESTGEWDLYEILSTIPAEEAYRPLSESQCELVQN
ncbi:MULTISPECIES: ABC transporter substrate-binding protein [Halomonadaceae]|jgi:branched-chain amino acid transport system substrate-binding protein|uniref:ABC transporter substrate-binding protein n=1 Tax=Halomonadaceae TaxID=28256 RepID=UPI0007FF60D1|nr:MULTISPECIES: ABC transporter substrate-binding protein [Halomonas]MCO7244980.1 ABC transporter substrate-binding protein [Halomonas sp. Mc5H-6]MDR5885322.1 ABC transporter substrate-binding protein [Halomonas janggokensis]OAZ96044.1 ABC transporter permease [Halomonas sp. G11]QPL44635.1 ABC transporter substrate-binding protein [Halomonas sp. A40-4]